MKTTEPVEAMQEICHVWLQGMAASREFTDCAGRRFSLALISRRSCLHPGMRYIARGLNALASPGNESECEQLVWTLPAGELHSWGLTQGSGRRHTQHGTSSRASLIVQAGYTTGSGMPWLLNHSSSGCSHIVTSLSIICKFASRRCACRVVPRLIDPPRPLQVTGAQCSGATSLGGGARCPSGGAWR